MALELSEEEVNDIINSQLLTVIGAQQSQDEEQLAALDVSYINLPQTVSALYQSSHAFMLSACLSAGVQ